MLQCQAVACSTCTFAARSPRKRTSTFLCRDAWTLHLARSVCGLPGRTACTHMAVNDGDWSAAKWLELIPPRDQPLALRNEEEEMIRSIQHGELKLEELASRLRKKPQG